MIAFHVVAERGRPEPHHPLDILDVGYWHDRGYEPPAQDWRDEYEAGGNRA